MSNSISSRPIAGDDDASLAGRGSRRRLVYRDRYPGIDADAMPDAVEEAAPTPIYDGLSAADKAAVDRLVVGYRMSKQQEIA